MEDKAKLSEIRKGIKLSSSTRKKISEKIISLIAVAVVITDIENNIDKQYSNLAEAANAIGISRTAIKKPCVSGNMLKKDISLNLKTNKSINHS